jgi:DNA polymerase II small subunit/DNA polymerase delta subunit B
MQTSSAIVVVPGAGDPGDVGVLPQPPLLRCAAQPLLDAAAAVTLASNPCRIQLYTKEVVIFAGERARLFQQHSLRPLTGARAEADEAMND